MELSWDDLKGSAREAFAVWTAGAELEWAEDAWARLRASGHTRYETAKERVRVVGRYLALIAVYHDWCLIAYDERCDDDLLDWIDGLSVPPLFVGQLVPDEELEEDVEGAFVVAVRLIAARERPLVVAALNSAYGGTSGLYRTLHQTHEAVDDAEGDALFEATLVNAAAYSWLDEGCPQVR